MIGFPEFILNSTILDKVYEEVCIVFACFFCEHSFYCLNLGLCIFLLPYANFKLLNLYSTLWQFVQADEPEVWCGIFPQQLCLKLFCFAPTPSLARLANLKVVFYCFLCLIMPLVLFSCQSKTMNISSTTCISWELAWSGIWTYYACDVISTGLLH